MSIIDYPKFPSPPQSYKDNKINGKSLVFGDPEQLEIMQHSNGYFRGIEEEYLDGSWKDYIKQYQNMKYELKDLKEELENHKYNKNYDKNEVDESYDEYYAENEISEFEDNIDNFEHWLSYLYNYVKMHGSEEDIEFLSSIVD